MGSTAGGPLPQQAGEGQVTVVPVSTFQWSNLQLSHIYSGSVNSWQKNFTMML